MSLVKIIVGSTRPGRFGLQPAEWLMQLAKEHPETTFELIDLQEINLPFLDEPQPAISGVYENEHTKAWAKLIDEADGFIIVSGEYNHTITPALINAIDFLASEWRHKPVAFVSYGANAGGTRAVEHLRDVAGQLGKYDLSETIAIPNYRTQVDDQGNFAADDTQVAAAHKVLKNAGFWAEVFKAAREKLAAAL